VTSSEALREVYGPNAAKKIAREFGVAIVTAKVWLAGRFPLARHEELARHIRAELARQETRRAEIRRQWAGGNVETNRAVDGVRTGVASRKADRLGRKVT